MQTGTVLSQFPLDVAYHQQDNEYYCGAACVLMVYSYFDAISPGTTRLFTSYLQGDIFNTIIKQNNITEATFTSGPKGLAKALNCNNPIKARLQYVCASSENRRLFSQYMAEQIITHKAPSIALVYGSAHWVLVTGVIYIKREGDTQWAIDGFMIHNPWPPIGENFAASEGFPCHDISVPLHQCGDGSVPSLLDPSLRVDRGAMSNHVSYQGWICEYWEQPCSPDGTQWDGRFVAITPGESNGTVDVCTNGNDATQYDRRPDKADNPCQADGKAITTQEEAALSAYEAMCKHGLEADPLWEDALMNQKGGVLQIEDCKEVKYYYKPGSYYLVWFLTAYGQAAVCARVDTKTGRYIESVAVPKKTGRAVTAMDAAGHVFRQGSIVVEGVKYDLTNLLEDLEIVWEYCDQSFSPFYPFYRVVVNKDGNPVTLFIRTFDEKGFLSLTHTVFNGV